MGTENIVLGTGVTELALSGTSFTQPKTVSLTLLCALSGLAVIPVLCDSTGRIGSVF